MLAFARSRSAILDGEIVALVDGVPSFEALQDRRVEASYVAFDVLALEGHSTIELPLRARLELLDGLIPVDQERLIRSRVFPSPAALYAEVAARGLEGIVAKDREPLLTGPAAVSRVAQGEDARGRCGGAPPARDLGARTAPERRRPLAAGA